jgi:maleamate amidohydrolase
MTGADDQSRVAGAGRRVWGRFLTEQDRAHLARRPHRPKSFGLRPALLHIDLYRAVFGDEPQPLLQPMEDWPSACGLAAWNAIPPLQQLLATARAARRPVIHTTGLSERPWSRTTDLDSRNAEDSAAHDRINRRYDIIDEAAPIEDELVIRKSNPSAFWGTPLIGHLVDRGIDTLIVGGEHK